MMNGRGILIACLFLLGSMVLVGCGDDGGSSIKSVSSDACEREKDCDDNQFEQDYDGDMDKCVDEKVEAAEKQLEEYEDCEGEFIDLAECTVKLSCRDIAQGDLEDCQDEVEKLTECMEGSGDDDDDSSE